MKNIRKDIENNLFILKCIYSAGRISFFAVILNILVETVAYYVGTNMGMWIFDSVVVKSFFAIVGLVVVIYAVLFLLQQIAEWINMYSVALASTRVTEHIMKKIIRKTFVIRQNEVENSNFYDKYSRAIAEVGTRPGEVLGMTSNIVGGLVQLVTISAVVFQHSVGYTLLILTVSMLSTIVSLIINVVEYKRYEDFTKITRKLSYVNRVIYQPEFSRLLRNNESYMYLLEKYYSNDSDEYRKIIKKYHFKLYCLKTVRRFISLIFLGIGPWMVIIYGLTNQMLTFGEATVIMSTTAYLPEICNKLFGSMVSIRKQSMYIDNLRYVLDYEDTRKKNSMEEKEQEADPVLEMQNVSFSYHPRTKLILKGINLEIKEKEKVALVGPNGAGKTTLACILSGLYSPSEGQVCLESANLDKIALSSINEKVIMVNQDVCILSFTIAENILQRPLKGIEDYELVDEALRKVGMYDRIMKLKNGVDTYITKEFDDDGVVFSGGELQKLAIARVYASNAKVVIMDEPTSALDAISEREIMDLLFELLADRTIIIISHRLSFMKKIDTIYYLESGRILEQGKHAELLAMEGKYNSLYRTQAERYLLCGGDNNAQGFIAD